MKIKNVLEVEYMPIFDDKFIVRIKNQNCDVLKRGEFSDEEIGVESIDGPSFICSILLLRGRNHNRDYDYSIVSKEKIDEIINKVELINKKYGIRVRERVGMMERYYYIDYLGDILGTSDLATDIDNTLYKIGNYFATRQEAEDSLIYKAFQKTKEDLKRDESRS